VHRPKHGKKDVTQPGARLGSQNAFGRRQELRKKEKVGKRNYRRLTAGRHRREKGLRKTPRWGKRLENRIHGEIGKSQQEGKGPFTKASITAILRLAIETKKIVT